ncbi:hypothetical protein BABINDRAFT_163186 [Babjeviella inositovora NRRL Y-12698]|uniref:V-type proton ATPase subunit a n=1 Tax=Babjeviella inositovora NRRL Y-12698 TaxID=984486 RepID=A0A1E3QJE3_9ASCO|nr:uncharacterized protein BABINDRAFT_163186 [Babjeviella inositovora NRRL Y-12698]ODQ77799.1 hypothetical protein BABINDRAFT_163186 [Babjeviella inositovora NRRL Y-12698]
MTEKDEAIFRSAEMSLVQLYIPNEISRDVVYTLGQSGLIQFRDLNAKVNSFQRSFVKETRRLDTVERQHRYFSEQLRAHGIEPASSPYQDDARAQATPNDIDEHVQNAQLLEARVVQMIDATEELQKRQTDLQQLRLAINASDTFFADFGGLEGAEGDTSEALESGVPAATRDNFVTGVVAREKIGILQRILWRALRGNLYFNTIEIREPVFNPKTKKYVNKDVFIVVSHGSLIMSRIRKIAESLDADLYAVDQDAGLRREALTEVNSRLADLTYVLETTTRTLKTELAAIGTGLQTWSEDIAKEKAIFSAMNLFNYDANRKTLVAEGWIARDALGDVQRAVELATERAASQIPTIVNVLQTSRTPPTFHRTNKFTAAFQNICDAYGIATYREVNPGLPTIVTFPFMFAIMFGDLGHGFIVTLAALFLVINEKNIGLMKRDEIFDMAFSGRYIILLMGIFSMYTGLMYNDLFSKSMTLFRSGWEWPEDFKVGQTVFGESVGVYSFGLDSAWHGTENALLFTNSYKMKLSILMGYLHMSYSYMFSLVNYLYFKSPIDLLGNFLPGLLFMQGIFGYLSLSIVYKWTVDWVAVDKKPPGLLNMLISMFLSPGTVAEELYPHQAKVQVVLLSIALICVPWLLLLKPLYLKRQLDREHHALPGTEAEAEVIEDDEEEHTAHDFGDIMIHQVIHTIEFCLNCVSHTASYLRLWALSLAHAQLSSVLWTMTLQGAFGATGVLGSVKVVLLFGMWFVLTVVILVMMEGTSAMLHSLRLHWVESMSKFFEGEGRLFEPFNFKAILAEV